MAEENTGRDKQRTEYQAAVTNNQLAILEKLVKDGYKPTQEDLNGYITLCINDTQANILKYLIENGAESKQAVETLIIVIMAGQIAITTLLVANGCVIDNGTKAVCQQVYQQYVNQGNKITRSPKDIAIFDCIKIATGSKLRLTPESKIESAVEPKVEPRGYCVVS
jgi:hypothetical protein